MVIVFVFMQRILNEKQYIEMYMGLMDTVIDKKTKEEVGIDKIIKEMKK